MPKKRTTKHAHSPAGTIEDAATAVVVPSGSGISPGWKSMG